MTTRTTGGGSGQACSSTLGLVLCGGASRRMGSDKALLELGGRRLIDYALSALDATCDEVRLATGSAPRYAELGRSVVLDAAGAQGEGPTGPLAGLVAGLAAAKVDGFDVLVASACDTPRVGADVFKALLETLARTGADLALLASHKGGEVLPEPLIGAYRVATCHGPAEDALAAGRRRLTAFHSGLRVELVDEHDVRATDPARNLNTPLDLEAEELLMQSRSLCGGGAQ